MQIVKIIKYSILLTFQMSQFKGSLSHSFIHIEQKTHLGELGIFLWLKVFQTQQYQHLGQNDNAVVLMVVLNSTTMKSRMLTHTLGYLISYDIMLHGKRQVRFTDGIKVPNPCYTRFSWTICVGLV